MPTQLLLHEDIGEAHSYHHCMVRYERHLILVSLDANWVGVEKRSRGRSKGKMGGGGGGFGARGKERSRGWYKVLEGGREMENQKFGEERVVTTDICNDVKFLNCVYL